MKNKQETGPVAVAEKVNEDGELSRRGFLMIAAALAASPIIGVSVYSALDRLYEKDTEVLDTPWNIDTRVESGPTNAEVAAVELDIAGIKALSHPGQETTVTHELRFSSGDHDKYYVVQNGHNDITAQLNDKPIYPDIIDFGQYTIIHFDQLHDINDALALTVKYDRDNIAFRDQPYLPYYGVGDQLDEKDSNVRVTTDGSGRWKLLSESEIDNVVTDTEKLEDVANGSDPTLAKQAKRFLQFLDESKAQNYGLNQILQVLKERSPDYRLHLESGTTLTDYETFSKGGDCDDYCMLVKSVVDKLAPPGVISTDLVYALDGEVGHAVIMVGAKDDQGQVKYVLFEPQSWSYALTIRDSQAPALTGHQVKDIVDQYKESQKA
jgi:hypothetical protein